MILVLVLVIDGVVVEDDLGINFFYFNILPQIIEKSLFLFYCGSFVTSEAFFKGEDRTVFC